MRRVAEWLGLTLRRPRWTPIVLGVSFLLAAVAVVNSGIHFFIVQTPSIPRGIYRETDAPLRRGAYVQFCPPKRYGPLILRRGYVRTGDCPAGTLVMGKRLVGMPGDTVTVMRRGVTVNGKLLPNSRPVFEDSKGRPLKPWLGTHVIESGEYFLFSGHHPLAYDSRYMGPVPAAGIRGVIRPILTSS